MKVDLTQMLIIFDELLPISDEEQGVYWFKSSRADGVSITLAFSIYHSYADIIVKSREETAITGLSLEKCSEIRVLDENKKCLEVIHENKNGRCFLSLLNNFIVEYTESNDTFLKT